MTMLLILINQLMIKIDITDDNTLANHAKCVHSAKTRKDFNKIYEYI